MIRSLCPIQKDCLTYVTPVYPNLGTIWYLYLGLCVKFKNTILPVSRPIHPIYANYLAYAKARLYNLGTLASLYLDLYV